MTNIQQAESFYIVGKKYYEASWVLCRNFSTVSSQWLQDVDLPYYYCAGFAIESFTKAFISLKCQKVPHDHDLNLLINFVDGFKTFFELNGNQHGAISILNLRYYHYYLYGKFDLRYISKPGGRISPHPDLLQKILTKMEKALRKEFENNQI